MTVFKIIAALAVVIASNMLVVVLTRQFDPLKRPRGKRHSWAFSLKLAGIIGCSVASLWLILGSGVWSVGVGWNWFFLTMVASSLLGDDLAAVREKRRPHSVLVISFVLVVYVVGAFVLYTYSDGVL
jgi:MFS family permease